MTRPNTTPDSVAQPGPTDPRLQHNLAIAAGAIVGVCARFTIGEVIRLHLPLGFPLGTLLVNLLGCLLMGSIQVLWLELRLIRREIQILITVGMLGGFTTFSTFSLETVQLLQTGQTMLALWYQALSLLGGIGAVAVGMWATRALHHRWRADWRKRS